MSGCGVQYRTVTVMHCTVLNCTEHVDQWRTDDRLERGGRECYKSIELKDKGVKMT